MTLERVFGGSKIGGGKVEMRIVVYTGINVPRTTQVFYGRKFTVNTSYMRRHQIEYPLGGGRGSKGGGGGFPGIA